eukprot:12900210-Prorocentrum_lima.AAC.1
MTGEVRVRSEEDDMELKIFPVLTNHVTSNFTSSSTIPTAAGMEGITKKPYSIFTTEQGCPYGRKCQYEHPEDCPGR